MTVNVGKFDRSLRLILGLVLILLPLLSSVAVFDDSTYRFGAIVVGMVLVGTSMLKFCPLYRIFGIRTCQR